MSTSTPSASGQAPVSRRILVVDDDLDARTHSIRILVQHGYRVDAAENGAIAWSNLQVHPYDLVVTDQNMPQVSFSYAILPTFIVRYRATTQPEFRFSRSVPWRTLFLSSHKTVQWAYERATDISLQKYLCSTKIPKSGHALSFLW